MLLLLIVGLLSGVLMGIFLPIYVGPAISPYVAIAIIAGLDSVLGGLAANLKGSFKLNIFISGFFTNAILAAGLAYLGKVLGIDLFIVAVIVFGTRMFQNLASIRRHFMDHKSKNEIF